MRVAFFGLGNMGAPMARRLVQAGHTVQGYDVSPEVRARMEQGPIKMFDTPALAAMNADAAITMLPNEQAVDTVLFGGQSVVEALQPGALILEMSTCGAQYIHRCQKKIKSLGLRVIDAPVCRGIHEAASGELIVLVGGEVNDFERAWPILENFARAEDILHVGPLGSGVQLKLINNYLSMVNMVVAAEGLNFAKQADINQDIAMRVFASTPAGKGQLLTNFPRKVLVGDTVADFPIFMGHKDLSLALDMGSQLGVPLFLGAAARQCFGLANALGRAEEDCTSMLHVLDDLSRN